MFRIFINVIYVGLLCLLHCGSFSLKSVRLSSSDIFSRRSVSVLAKSLDIGSGGNDNNRPFSDSNVNSDSGSTKPRSKRQGVGRPQRKLSAENGYPAGRISVYCVGSSIDLQALRVHIFRRGFGRVQNETEKQDLVLSKVSGEIEDDGVLHISNAPLFVSAISYNSESVRLQSLPEVIGDNFEEDLSGKELEMAMKTKEALLMATQDIFYFAYGCVVFWGLTKAEEKAALTELNEFTEEPVSSSELEESYDTMEFVFDRKANPQRPIRFDRMRLRSLQTAEKLALSYAMAQSSKLFVFEDRVLSSVEMTRYLPKELAVEGKIATTKKDLNKLIGQLFVVQTEVNLFSSILDTPDFLWDDDEHQVVYQYTRSYLEVDDRVALLNSRLTVIRELLDVLTAQIADTNSTRLEWIVIWLITVEIVMGIASSPLFVGRRVISAILVPTAILMYNMFKK